MRSLEDHTVQIIWKVSKGSGIGIPAKVIRIKGAETFLNNNQLYFEQGAWNEPLFNETVKFNGQRSNITRKDDQVDSLGMLTDAFLVKDTGGVQAPTEEQMQMEREARNLEHIKAQHARIFGIPRSTGPQRPSLHATTRRRRATSRHARPLRTYQALKGKVCDTSAAFAATR